MHELLDRQGIEAVDHSDAASFKRQARRAKRALQADLFLLFSCTAEFGCNFLQSIELISRWLLKEKNRNDRSHAHKSHQRIIKKNDQDKTLLGGTKRKSMMGMLSAAAVYSTGLCGYACTH